MNVRQVVPKDAIPSIDDPAFDTDYFGDPDDLVIVVESDAASVPPRAYPIRVLHYHEIVNDATGDRPIAVTWCPLCASAIVYDAAVDKRVLTFGVSGKLADDDLVMYDRETDAEWKQSTGECLAGAFEGRSLSVLPAGTYSYEGFAAEYPDGVVLQPPGGESEAASDDDAPATIRYDVEPYDSYFTGEGFGLDAHRDSDGGATRTWDRTDLAPKAVVLGVERDGEACGFPLERVREAGGVVETTVGETDVVVFATADTIHAFKQPGHAFESTDDSQTVRADGTEWDVETGRGADGRQLERLPTRRLFAFAWQDDHGPEAFFDG
ncbi:MULTISPECIES: DUF3179 domain-containing protein [Halococcus]|uniref:DUF3179 domain-containing protein n=1 Tax=Halococcus salifodinae DSM 8989 TaxID=1227456 RepID=M0N620_9EURY|nr:MULTISPECIES: DUF3179 domain-containing protein [Halococcus]EMA53326.1 hypothetical protein C450_08427 [Halococcus salifodinae DSM 8989]